MFKTFSLYISVILVKLFIFLFCECTLFQGKFAKIFVEYLSKWAFYGVLNMAYILCSRVIFSNCYVVRFTFCLAHIKISDRAIKILRVGRPIYQVRLSPIRRRRAFTLKICTANNWWKHFCLASVDHRPSIGRYLLSRATNHQQI